MKEKILKQFDEHNQSYSSLGKKCLEILRELLEVDNISMHHITTRTKDRDSLSKKIDTKENKYSDITEITDICGIRIITYLDSDVDKVANIIEKEFSIDAANSIDKRALKADQFGYRSLHYVVSLSETRLKLTENKKFKSYKIEIQVRSILQHAWAEIEHDLGYKGEFSVPEHFKRNFNRLAALLETADIEFDRLKKDLTQYEIEVKKNIINQPNEVPIDQASVLVFTENSPIFNESRKIIQNNTGCQFVEVKGGIYI
jgi:putative GTP pyrophosphokinase